MQSIGLPPLPQAASNLIAAKAESKAFPQIFASRKCCNGMELPWPTETLWYP
jgi:hypothetical protein